MKVKSALVRFGGKSRLASELVRLFPKHGVYVEPFAGACHVLFAKDRNVSSMEVINDLDSGLYAFYSVIVDPTKFERFHEIISRTPHCREFFEECRNTWRNTADEVLRAVKWFVVARQSYRGILGNSWQVDKQGYRNGTGKSVKVYLSAIEALRDMHERLKTASIEHKDFRKILKYYDDKTTLFYLDPPYVPDTRRAKKVYEHEMSAPDHGELVELLLKIKGKAMLSGYPTPLYGALECAGWKKIEFDAYCTTSAVITRPNESEKDRKKRIKRTECVWMNY